MESVVRVHNRCGSLVQRSDNKEYEYQCCDCDEDLFRFETHQIEITDKMEFYALEKDNKYLYDRDGDVMLFESEEQAKIYIHEYEIEDDEYEIKKVR